MTETPATYASPRVVGLDPGTSFGIAHYCGGRLIALHTLRPHDAITHIRCLGAQDLVIIEDSRLQSASFRNATKDSKAVAFSKGRSVGRVDMLCQMVEWVCEEGAIPLISLSPKDKGAKLAGKEEFRRVTGWEGKSNQHGRDAAMVAFRFRNNAGARKII